MHRMTVPAKELSAGHILENFACFVDSVAMDLKKENRILAPTGTLDLSGLSLPAWGTDRASKIVDSEYVADRLRAASNRVVPDLAVKSECSALNCCYCCCQH